MRTRNYFLSFDVVLIVLALIWLSTGFFANQLVKSTKHGHVMELIKKSEINGVQEKSIHTKDGVYSETFKKGGTRIYTASFWHDEEHRTGSYFKKHKITVKLTDVNVYNLITSTRGNVLTVRDVVHNGLTYEIEKVVEFDIVVDSTLGIPAVSYWSRDDFKRTLLIKEKVDAYLKIITDRLSANFADAS